MDSSFLFTGGISVLALIVAFYSVILGTQRIPNFLSSIYILIKYAILYLVFVVFLMLLYETILKSRININENGLFFIQAGTFLIIVLSLGYFLLKEYHKVFSMRTYRHSWENFTILFPWSRKSQEKKTKYLERKQICEFCDNFLPTQKK